MYNGYTEARARANKKYNGKFATVCLRMSEDVRDGIKAHAQQSGESVNAFIIRAIAETMERDRRIRDVEMDRAEANRRGD